MKTIVIISILFLLNSIIACGDTQTVHRSLTEKEKKAKIKEILKQSQITISEIDETLSYNENTVTLNKYFNASSGATYIRVRKRGVLLDGNKLITSFSISGGGRGNGGKTTTSPTPGSYFVPNSDTYAGLFDGNKKKLISTHLLGSYLSVVSIVENRSDSSVIEISALVREAGAPASKIQTFQVTIENNTIKSLD